MKRKLVKITAVMLATIIVLLPYDTYAKQTTGGSSAVLVKDIKEGDTIGAFTVTEVSRLEAFGADVFTMEHDRTGARVQFIRNNDPNKYFMLSFSTRATDDKGLPHVFEHSVTNGSKKYPSHMLTLALYNRSYLTIGNAYTISSCTMYPIASYSEKQLYNFADYYTDLCFNPLILEDEAIFKKEAVRYILPDEKSEMTVGGTVYSEMSGAYTCERLAKEMAHRLLDPTDSQAYDSGGVPSEILKLGYSEVKAYHEKYYHPSNCIAYLYGDIKDPGAFLDLLDSYFEPYDKKEFDTEKKRSKSTDGYYEKKYDFPAAMGSGADKRSALYYAIDLGDLTDEEVEDFMFLSDYFNSDSSIFNLRLKSLYPAAKFETDVSPESGYETFSISASGMNENDSDLFKDAVQRIFADIAQRGLSNEDLDSFRTNMENAHALSREGTRPERTLLLSAAILDGYGRCDNTFFNYTDRKADMKWFDNTLIKRLVSEHLKDPKRSSMAIAVPRPGLSEENSEKLEASLKKMKESMSEEEIRKLVDENRRVEQLSDDDPSEYLEKINTVKVSDLSDPNRVYKTSDKTDKDGTRRIDVYTQNDRISHTGLFLDVTGLPEEDLCYMALYVDLVNGHFIPTGNCSRNDLPGRIGKCTVKGQTISYEVTTWGSDYKPYVYVNFMTTNDRCEDAFDLLYDRLFDSKFDSADRIAEGISAILNTVRNNMNKSPERPARLLGASDSAKGAAYYEYTHYLGYYDFLKGLQKKLKEDPNSVCEKLSQMGDHINNRCGAVFGCAVSEQNKATYRKSADEFIGRLGCKKRVPVEYKLTKYDFPLAVAIDNPVAYNITATGDISSYGIKTDDMAFDITQSIICDGYLRPEVREKGGAYAYSYIFEHPIDSIFTARDPNIARTMDIFENMGEAWINVRKGMDQKTLDEYIIKEYSVLSLSTGDIGDASNIIIKMAEGKGADYRSKKLAALKKVTLSDLQKYDSVVEKLGKDGNRVTLVSGDMIDRNKELFSQIIRPFDRTAR